jgi:signal transduction histidine kinase
MKTRIKIILLFTSIFISFLISFSLAIYLFISEYSYTDFYKRLEIRSYSYAKSELDADGGAFIKQFKGEYLEPLTDEQHYIFKIIDTASVLREAEELNLPLEVISGAIQNGEGNGHIGEVFYAGIIYHKDNDQYLVLTSAVNYYYGHHNTYLRNVLIILIIVSIILVIFISYWFSKRMITPLKKLTFEMNRISSENLNSRLAQKEDDEIGMLIETFNNMLDRLETSFESQNNFISNASHELNTPLTSIIGQADVALNRERTIEEYRETIHNILLEAEKLENKTKALLFLAQTGFDGKAIAFKEVRLDQILFDVQETVNRLHPDNKVKISLENLPDEADLLKINGNKQLLHLAFSNIVLNGYKYSNNQDVLISFGEKEGIISVSIMDKGIGIPSEELKYIYDPFFRGSNTGNFEGYGIGMPLARNIIKLHKGQLIVDSDQNRGTLVLVKLPILGFL